MSPEENKAILSHFYELWNQRKMDEVVTYISPTYFDHAMPPELAHGIEGFLKARALGRKALADIYLQVDDLLATENDYVTARVSIHATHIGDYKGIPATGKRFVMETISIMRMADGLIAEHWELANLSSVLDQLGATIVIARDVPVNENRG